MSLKIYLTAFISVLFLSFPQNLIGCSDSGDPKDYFTSFFSRDLSDNGTYTPFYYTSLLTFYDDWDWDTVVNYDNDKVISEWREYCGSKASRKEVANFIYGASEKELSNLLQHIKNNNIALSAPDSFRKNSLTQCFISQKAVATVNYLSSAKKIEGISKAASEWEEAPPRDSSKLNNYIAEANQQFNTTTDAFLKSKYAFLRCKIAFYNNRSTDCINWYDGYFSSAPAAAVNNLALSYKGGSLYRLGKNKEAAYAFAKAFQSADYKKKENYLGFLWATERCNPSLKEEYVAFAKSNEDKALLRALFSMHGVNYQLQDLQSIYRLHPTSPILPLLVTREINKIEEQYLTPMLAKEEGGQPFYFSWTEGNTDSLLHNKTLQSFIPFLEQLYKEGKAVNRELYITGAAYLSFISKEYGKAKTLVKEAEKAATTNSVKDQLQLINLLIAVNEKGTIDNNTETAILPSVKWLVEKAKNDKIYETFLRNFFSQILAQKYRQQKELHKAAMAYGIADLAFLTNENSAYGNGLEFVRSEMETGQLVKLHQTLTAPATLFEQFLVKHTSFKKEQVIDVVGTAYLRDHQFTKAIEWLSKAQQKEPLLASNYNYTTDKEVLVNVNPLHDYLNDWQRYDKPLAKPYTKLSLAQKLIELQQKADTAKSNETKAKTYYQLANVFYNMSHYGNSWNAVTYYRSGSDWNAGNYTTDWQKEYYGVYKAKDYYEKAYTLSLDKEFKAAAYFLMAKCIQRQLPVPLYNYNNSEQYEKEQLVFEKKFKNNVLFPQFIKEFGTTKFYQYTYSRCSYLRDFVKKQSPKK